jgi:hybrid polyketide synthase/nonribosomal peptide synthetase ACE1
MMKMHITHSTLYAVNVNAGQQFLLLGVSEKDGRQYLALGPHSESALHVSEKLAHCCSVPAGQEGSFVALVAANFLCMAMTKQLHPGQTLLLHNPPELLASVLEYHARQAALNIIFTTTVPEFTQSSPWIYLHPFLGQRRLQELLPTQVDLAVNMTDPKHTSKHTSKNGFTVSSELLGSLPTSCRREPLGHFMTSQAHVLLPSQHDKTRDTFDIAIELALQSLTTMTVKPDITIPIQQLNHTRDVNSDLMYVVDWTADAAVPVQLFPVDTGLSFPPNRTYWLAGLSSSFGLSLCDWMIGHGARHFVISSRLPRLDAVWLDRARCQGAIIKVAANDITDETSLLTLYRDICAELPPLAGVVHGAMVLRDSPLRDMTYETMMEALGPKVQGSINLDRILGDTTLDFCIFLSSLANTIGNAGQANYSAANAFLCSLARQRRQRGLNTVAINLGLVIGIGAMGTDLAVAIQTELTKRHFLPVSEPDLHQIFAEAIVACHLDSPYEGEMLTELPSLSSYSTLSFRPVWASDPKFGALIGSSNGAMTQKRGHKKPASIADRLHKVQTKRHLAKLVTGKTGQFRD